MANDHDESYRSIKTRDGKDYLLTPAETQRLGEEGVFFPKKCSQCGCTCYGMEPLYPLASAAELVPFPSVGAMHKWLHDHPKDVAPPIYKKHHSHRVRMISVSDICRIRKLLFNPYSGGSPKSPVVKLMRLANANNEDPKSELIVQAIERKANS